MSVTREYLVSGMHCNHCVGSITEEISAVSGVIDVKVDLGSGQLIVISDTEIPFENIEAAVDEAGYSVATA
jgi:copper chaperone CopZ